MAKVTTLFPAFGGNRTNAHFPGEILGKCEWIGVPFAGGMPEVPHLKARSIVVNDTHLHIINCARAVRDYGPGMEDYLNATIFHQEELSRAQDYCRQIELWRYVPLEDIAAEVSGLNGCHFGAAVNYFITQWMGRSGQSSTNQEFTGNLSTRWTSSGGDSNVRFRSATNAIADFSSAFRKCNFTALDFRAFLTKVKDDASHGLYCDPPWPDLGGEYSHTFSTDDQKHLSRVLTGMKSLRTVVRFGEHDLIHELYKEIDGWKWRNTGGRTQGNNSQSEWFISRNCE